MTASAAPPTTLSRSVGLWGAVFLGLGSILGTGVFIALGLAAGLAGSWAMGALALAAALATCNALSSAQLAAAHPVSGGTYAYGRRYIAPHIGFLAGVCFLLAKSASAAAAAIGVISYSARLLGFEPVLSGPFASLFVLAMGGCVLLGLRRANALNMALVAMTLAALIGLIIAALFYNSPPPLDTPAFVAPNVFEAAALIFVAFTGYGRIATLGEEIIDPARNIPRAIIITVAVSTLIYGGVLWAGLHVLGPTQYGIKANATGAPLEIAAQMMNHPTLATFIAFSAITAMAGVLLNLILGLSRVALAMGRAGDLPRCLATLSPKAEPQVAVVAVVIFIALLALTGGLALVWSFSAFTVLLYYSVTNWAALRLPPAQRLYPRLVSWVGLLGCLSLSLFIEPKVMMLAAAVLTAALILRNFVGRRA